MSQIIGQDLITGMGFIGLEPGRIYRMRRGPKVTTATVRGNPAVLEHSVRGRFKGLTVYGKSTQVTTTGAQLFVSKKSQESNAGMTLTQKDDGGWHLEGTCTADNSRNIRLLEPTEYFTLPSGDYTLSFTGAIPDSVTLNIAKVANVHKQNEQWTHLGSINKNRRNLAISLDGTEEALSMYVIFPAQVALSFDFYVMLNAGDTVLPWEPYTGGKPSPSPDYPQVIQSAGDGGSIGVEVHGKNIFGGRYYYANYSNGVLIISGNGKENEVKLPFAPTRETFGVCKVIKCQKGKTYVISVTNPNKNAAIGMAEYENIEKAIAFNNALGFVSMSYAALKKSYIAKSDGILICGIAGIWTDGKTTLHECTESELLQVEEASEATSYEPYHPPQTLTLSTQNGLPGIPVDSGGNYTDEAGRQWICDEIDLERGVYVQRIKKDIITDTTWRITVAKQHEFAADILHNVGNVYSYVAGLCDRYKVVTSSDRRFEDKTVIFGISGYQLFVCDKNFSSIDEIATYFTEHPMTIMYPLATPVETPLAGSEIAAYKGLRAYTGTTVVEASDGAGLSVSYGCNLKAAEKDVNKVYASLMAEMEDLNENSKTL